MRLSKIVRSLLKTAVYVMDQTADQVDRASDRASDFADKASDFASNARESIYPTENHTLRNIVSFAAGIGVGVGMGILLAPASGADIRSSIGDKVQEIGSRVRHRGEAMATGSDLH